MPFEWDLVSAATSNIDSDGFDETQHDAYGEQGSPPYETHHPLGVWSRHLDGVQADSGQIDAAKAGNLLVALEGGVGHAIRLEDPRVMVLVPAPALGETVVYNSFGAFTRYHADGSISHATTTDGGAASGQTIAERITPTSFERFAPWGREIFDARAYRITHQGGSKMTMGFISGPGPLASGQSYWRCQADIVEINGGKVSVGPSGVDTQPVAKAQPLVSVLQSMMTAIQGLQAAIAAITAGSTNGGTAALGVANAIPLVQSAQADVSSALETISTQSAFG